MAPIARIVMHWFAFWLGSGIFETKEPDRKRCGWFFAVFATCVP
jgi:hypothetical protein